MKKPSSKIFYEFGFTADNSRFSGDCVYTEANTMKFSHFHSDYEILYVYKSSRTLYIEGKTHTLSRGCVAVIPPYFDHRTASEGTLPQARLILNFCRNVANNLEARYGISVNSVFGTDYRIIPIPEEDIDNFHSVMKKFPALSQKKDELSTTLFDLYLCIVIKLLESYSHTDPCVSKSQEFVSIVTDYINEHCNEDISLSSLSQSFYKSPYEISRLFTRCTGISFTENLSRIRIDKAKSLLVKTNLSISEIADATGFLSSSNFSRVFRRITNESPTQFRKRKS